MAVLGLAALAAVRCYVWVQDGETWKAMLLGGGTVLGWRRRVGPGTAGTHREIRFPDDLLRRHHLYVARTRMGKSTLMHHIVTHKMREKAEGRDTDAIVVVDPHADLVNGLLEQVPDSLVNRVRLIDLADDRALPASTCWTPAYSPHRRLGGARGPGPLGPVGAQDAVHPGADRQDPPRGQ